MGGGCLLFFRVFVVVVFLLYILLLLSLLAFLLFLCFTNKYHKTICFSFFQFLYFITVGLGNYVINSILYKTHQFIIGQYTNA